MFTYWAVGYLIGLRGNYIQFKNLGGLNMVIMEEESVKLALEGRVSEIVINRPKALNALNVDVLQSLVLIFEKLSKNRGVRAVIISGEGDKAFVAGADIHSMAQLGQRAAADYVELGQRTMRAIERFHAPVIAAVNGYALGGGLELALACDIIVGSKAARVGQPEVNLGVIPGFGGTQRLIHRCGIGVARRLTFTGDIIDSDEALRIGIFDKLCEPTELMADVRAMAERIAEKAPLAVVRAKEVLRQAHETALLSGLRLEVEAFLELFGTVDREEGMSAFMQKREAKFTGK
jgi:enoyl-CoA hydratase